MKKMSAVCSVVACASLAGCGMVDSKAKSCSAKAVPPSREAASLHVSMDNPSPFGPGPLGALLVFDRVNSASFIEKGYDGATIDKDSKCGASVEVEKKDGRYIATLGTTEGCYVSFTRYAKNPRILLSLPGHDEYISVKAKNGRMVHSDAYLKAVSRLGRARREATDVGTQEHTNVTMMSFFATDVKGLDIDGKFDLYAQVCDVPTTAEPTPLDCLWFRDTHFDVFELVPEKGGEALLDEAVAYTKAQREISRKALLQKAPVHAESILNHARHMAATQDPFWQLENTTEAFYLAMCNPSDATDTCAGDSRQVMDEVALKLVELYAPNWLPYFKAELAKPDRATALADYWDKSDAEFLDKAVRPHFAPAFEGYLSFRDAFLKNKDLVGIATHYVDLGGKGTPPIYGTLSPFASKAPAALAGITFSLDSKGNLLMKHPGALKNRNLALDGHLGSVVTFAGVPILPFDPREIDQSDATTRMPLPKTKARATRESGRGPATENKNDKSKSTTGEGKNGDAC